MDSEWKISTPENPPGKKRKETAGQDETEPSGRTKQERTSTIARLQRRLPHNEDEWRLYRIKFGLDSDKNIASTVWRIGLLKDLVAPGHPHGTYSEGVNKDELTKAISVFQQYICAIGSYLASVLGASAQQEVFESYLGNGYIYRTWRTEAKHLAEETNFLYKTKKRDFYTRAFYMSPNVWDLKQLHKANKDSGTISDLRSILDQYCGATDQLVLSPAFFLGRWFPGKSYKDICTGLGTEYNEQEYTNFLDYCSKLNLSHLFENNNTLDRKHQAEASWVGPPLDRILTINLGKPLQGYFSIDASEATQGLAIYASRVCPIFVSKGNNTPKGETAVYPYNWSAVYDQPVVISALKDLGRDGILALGEQAVSFDKRALQHLRGSTITPTKTIQIIVSTSDIRCTVTLSHNGWKRYEKWGIQRILVLDEDIVFTANRIAYISLLASKQAP